MEENEISNLPAPLPVNGKSIYERISFWIGIIGTVVTLVLTIWNANTKMKIDQREENLKSLEVELKERSTNVEESKERVDRYKWVFSLYPNLNVKDDKEKNFTINLIRLALTKEEAQQLFTGFQSSSDTTLQSLGNKGINVIEIEPILVLAAQMNGSTAEIRKHAVAMLAQDYKSSSPAIDLVLRMYDRDRIKNLSASGLINGLYFLSLTDPDTWNKEQIVEGRDIVKRILASNPGRQTKKSVEAFESLLVKLETQD
jgi:hypothetical protein